MKNLWVVLLIVLCSIWLLWIKLHQVSPPEAASASTRDTASVTISKPKTAREFYQALNGLIRVFESDLTLDHLTPITTALSTHLARMSIDDRYRIYVQLEQALDAYTHQLNREQGDILERYAALQSQLWQQLDTQQEPNETTASETPDSALVDTNVAEIGSTEAAEPMTASTDTQNPSDQLQTSQAAAFAQQWPAFVQQGLSSKQQQLLDALAKQQIEIAYAGEGSFAFRLNPNYWVEHVAPHLAKADQVYFQHVAEQTQQPYADDAGLLISWLELGQRVQVWAQYVQDHPDGYFTEMAQAKRDGDLNTLLVGMDNTPTHEQGVLLPEVKAAYAQLIQQYPNSQLSKALSLFEQQLAEQPDDVPSAARRAIALAKDTIQR